MNKEEAITELLKAARGYERDLLVPRDLKKIFSRVLDAYALHIIKRSIPAEDRPKLGSENQDTYVAYSYGWNDAREQTLKTAEALLTPPTEK